MDWTQRQQLAPVKPSHLAAAYEYCEEFFALERKSEPVPAPIILSTLERSILVLERREILNLFRRLCLAIDLVRTIDANWNETGFSFSRPKVLPLEFFELVSVEPAYEAVMEEEGSVFFERDVFEEALMIFEYN